MAKSNKKYKSGIKNKSVKKNMLAKKIKANKAYWEPLSKGDLVDIIAPGFRTTDEKLAGAVQFLKEIGLRARVPKDLFGPDVVASNTDEIRLKHLLQAYQAKDSKAVWCVRGGYGAIRLIEKFSKLKKPKTNKLFIGYSDSSTFHNFLNKFWGFASLHGPLLDRLGQKDLPQDQVQEMLNVIFGQQSEVVFKNLKPLNVVARSKKLIQASVVGGNLTDTQSYLATPFYKAPQNQILFFEDIGERGYRVDRILKQLAMAGYFKNVKAVVFGEFIGSDEPVRSPGDSSESRVPAVLARFASEMKFPVFTGMEVGHGSLQRPLPLAMPAELKCGATGELKVKVPVVAK